MALEDIPDKMLAAQVLEVSCPCRLFSKILPFYISLLLFRSLHRRRAPEDVVIPHSQYEFACYPKQSPDDDWLLLRVCN